MRDDDATVIAGETCSVLRVDCAGVDLPQGPFGPFACDDVETLGDALLGPARDALLVHVVDAQHLLQWPALAQAAFDGAVVALVDADAATTMQLLRAGVQDVLAADAHGDLRARAVRQAVERKRLERSARTAYATDLATGLPNHAQLLEHMTHLLALREREPAPMALLVLRVEGLAQTGAAMGAEAANVLRRKAAVRLRAALRASDVVAAIGPDAFAVLLAWIDAPDDGERVASKLAQSLAQPYGVAGRTRTLSVQAGLALYPQHGKTAELLLRRAVGQAASVATVGAAGVASSGADRGPAAAANDDDG